MPNGTERCRVQPRRQIFYWIKKGFEEIEGSLRGRRYQADGRAQIEGILQEYCPLPACVPTRAGRAEGSWLYRSLESG